MAGIYMDYNATTPIRREVGDLMLPYLRGEFGNPSSSYALGRRAKAAVQKARAQVAAGGSHSRTWLQPSHPSSELPSLGRTAVRPCWRVH